jgi:hypothetical protein
MYYDVFAQSYCYYNGFNWLQVTMLPQYPMFSGFNPYTSYIVVLNRSVNQPWTNHAYYEQNYPTGYYKSAFTPRTSLGSNTVLRAYDENQSKALFVDKRSNKEISVKYDVRTPRSSQQNNTVKTDLPSSSITGRNPKMMNLYSNNTEVTATQNPKQGTVKQNPVQSPQVETIRNNSIRESQVIKQNPLTTPPPVKNNDPRNNSIRNETFTNSGNVKANSNAIKGTTVPPQPGSIKSQPNNIPRQNNSLRRQPRN